MSATKTEFQLFKRVLYKNGRVGDWTLCRETANTPFLRSAMEFERDLAKNHGGRAVEFLIKSREVTEWTPVSEVEVFGREVSV